MYLLVECIEREITTPWQHDTLVAAQENMCRLFAEATHIPEDEVLDKLRGMDPDEDILDLEDGDTYLMRTSACTEQHGQNYDWRIFQYDEGKGEYEPA